MQARSIPRSPSRRPSLAAFAGACVLGITAFHAAAQDARQPNPSPAAKPPPRQGAAADASRLLILQIVLNGSLRPEPVYAIRAPDGSILVEEAALERWRVRRLWTSTVEHDGARFVDVARLANAKVRLDERTQTLHVSLPPSAFDAETVSFSGTQVPVARPPDWGGFFNYTAFGYRDQRESYLSGLFEVGAFGPYGVGLGSFSANTPVESDATSGRAVRLDTTWRYDDPARLRTLVVGDSVSTAGSWGRSVRFGGFQYGTNFATQPGFVTYPLQAVAGTATLPSTVDIFVNNVRVGGQRIDAGPFTITQIPTITGAGDVQLVVRDLFGQQQVISQPFYASTALLREGLDDFQVQFGSVRENYAIRSFDYSGWIGAATWRRGITNRLTLEAHAEGDNSARAAGLTGNWLAGDIGVITVGGAASNGDAGSGALLLLGFDRSTRQYGFGVRSVWATEDFRVAGGAPLPPGPIARVSVATASVNLVQYGTLGVAWAAQRYRGSPGLDTVTASYSVPLWRFAYFTVSVSRTFATQDQTTVSAGISIPLGEATASALGQSTHAGSRSSSFGTIQLQKGLPIGEGYGYRLYADTEERYEAGAAYAGPYGRYQVEAASAKGNDAVRGTVAGGIGLVGGTVFASQPLTDSFAVVRTGGIRDVRVLQENNLAALTDAQGEVILTRLPPYTPTRLSIDPRTVPIGASLDADRRTIVPYFRSGTVVDFPVRVERSVVLVLLLEDGKPVPAGAVARIAGRAMSFPVGLGGRVFLTDVGEGATVRVTWRGTSCDVDFKVGATTDPVPEIGPLVCAGVPR